MSLQRAKRGPAWCLLACLALLYATSLAASQQITSEGEILLAFKANITNWDAVTGRFLGWTNGSAVCGWTGTACNSAGQLTQLVLPNLTLTGPLSESLGGLQQLQKLDLQGNRFSGSLPQAWGSSTAFPALQELYLTSNALSRELPSDWGSSRRWQHLANLQLGSNNLTGGLPASWALKGAFPKLTQLDLSGNQLAGPLPPSWGGAAAWSNLTNLDLSNNSFRGGLPPDWGANGSFASLAHLLLANNGLSGSLPASWASRGQWDVLQTLSLLGNDFTGVLPPAWVGAGFPKLVTLLLRPGNPALCGSVPLNATAVQSLSSSGQNVPLTGTLGSCAQTCNKSVASRNITNLFDLSVQAGVALTDLLRLNPSVNVNAPILPGTALTQPCYGSNPPSYLGGNIAYGKSATQSSTVGDGAAGAAVASPDASVNGTCSMTQDGTASDPAWWMLDLGVSTDIAGLIIATQVAVPDLKIAIGDSDIFGSNSDCSVGVQIEANATTAQTCNGKGRYLSFSRVSGGAISICGLEVFPIAANAAVAKHATASGGLNASAAVDGADAGCASLKSNDTNIGPWVTVDMGYQGRVSAVGIDLGAADLLALDLRVGNKVVSTGTENGLCQPTIANLPGYSKTLFGCSALGRYVTVQAPRAGTLDLCLMSVFLQDVPASANGLASDLTLAPGPAVEGPLAPSVAPAPNILSPSQIVNIGFRLVLIGPYVVEFDGKGQAVVRALQTTLQPVEPIAINITSYTVGAPVPADSGIAPAPSPDAPASGRRLQELPGAVEEDQDYSDSFINEHFIPRRSLQQPTSGAVIVNVVVRTTAAKEAATISLMQTSISSGNFTKALLNAGLDAAAVKYSVVPIDGVAVPAPEAAPGIGAPNSPSSASGSAANGSIPIDGSGGKAGGSSGAAIGGGVAAAVVVFLALLTAAVFLLRRRRRKQRTTSALAAGGKGDVETGSDTGSSTVSDGAVPSRGGCWPLWRGDRNFAAHGGTPSERHDSTAFLSKGGSSASPGKLNSVLSSNSVHANSHHGSLLIAPVGRANGRSNDSAHMAEHSAPGTPGSGGLSERGTDDGMLRSAGGSSNLLLPQGAFMRSNSSGLLGSPSGWETPLGMGPGGPDGAGFLSPEQQMTLGGNLALLQRGVSDVTSDVEPEVIPVEDVPSQQWQSHSAELWPIVYRELTFLKQIGEGSFGRVYMARWRETTVAVKVLHRQTGDHQDDDLPLDPCPSAGSPDPILAALQKEAAIMASVRHPNVISYLGVCADPACIVTEYCSKGSLTDVLRRGRASAAHAAALDWPRRLNMAMDAAKGMLHLHLCDPPIIHRDLKSPNLLVDKHWKLKVCDFNLSRVMEESVVLSSMVASNPRWLAPEILSGLPYSVAADVYSFGIIMWELLTWEVPWHQQNTWQVHAMVTVEHLRPDIPADISGSPGGTFGGIGDYLDLMKDCWAQSPEDRPDFEHVIGKLRRMLAVETLATRAPSESGGGSPSRLGDRGGSSSALMNQATASAPGLI